VAQGLPHALGTPTVAPLQLALERPQRGGAQLGLLDLAQAAVRRRDRVFRGRELGRELLVRRVLFARVGSATSPASPRSTPPPADTAAAATPYNRPPTCSPPA